MLEDDSEAADRLRALPGGAALLATAVAARARLEAALGDDADTILADRRYGWIHDLVGRAVRVWSLASPAASATTGQPLVAESA